MRKGPKLILTIIVGMICACLLILYIYVESKNYLIGPTISVAYPINKSEVYGPEVEIRGQTRNVSAINLNDNPIFITKNGTFNQKLILPDGYNIMKFEATDRFGKKTEKLLEFMVTGAPRTN